MRVIHESEAAMMAVGLIVTLAAVGALIGAAAYGTSLVPTLLPVWPGIVMAFAIGAIDRTRGDARRGWAWVAMIAGTLAIVTLLLT